MTQGDFETNPIGTAAALDRLTDAHEALKIKNARRKKATRDQQACITKLKLKVEMLIHDNAVLAERLELFKGGTEGAKR